MGFHDVHFADKQTEVQKVKWRGLTEEPGLQSSSFDSQRFFITLLNLGLTAVKWG